jgi:predicted nucleic acid-binding protein
VTEPPNYLIDTGVFILYLHGDREATRFFRETHAVLYYSRVARKELLRPPISARERERVITCLRRYRLVNPDPQIARRFSLLLEKYAYLRDHLADAFLAATAWEKHLEVVTTNARHFEPIAEIRVRRFPEDWKNDEKKHRTLGNR